MSSISEVPKRWTRRLAFAHPLTECARLEAALRLDALGVAAERAARAEGWDGALEFRFQLWAVDASGEAIALGYGTLAEMQSSLGDGGRLTRLEVAAIASIGDDDARPETTAVADRTR